MRPDLPDALASPLPGTEAVFRISDELAALLAEWEVGSVGEITGRAVWG